MWPLISSTRLSDICTLMYFCRYLDQAARSSITNIISTVYLHTVSCITWITFTDRDQFTTVSNKQKMTKDGTYQIRKQLWNSITWGKKCHLLFSSLCSSASLWSNWSANRLALAARPLFKSSQSNWTISKWATVGKELISRASERNCWISCNSKMRLLWRQTTLNALCVQWLYNNNNN